MRRITQLMKAVKEVVEEVKHKELVAKMFGVI